MNLDIARVVGYSKFCNKLWNVTRFAFRYIEEANPNGFTPALLDAKLSLVDADGLRRPPLGTLTLSPNPAPQSQPSTTQAPTLARRALARSRLPARRLDPLAPLRGGRRHQRPPARLRDRARGAGGPRVP